MRKLKNVYYLSISGIKFSVAMEKEIEITRAFFPFVTNQQHTDFKACFQKVTELPLMPEETLYEDRCYRVHLDDAGRFLKSFFNPPKDYTPYAISYYDELQKCLNVKYLEKGEKCLSEFQNTFFHLSFEEILIRHKRLCVHASCVETDFGGILFSGPSGIGKSTQAENWCKYRGALQINGDRPILSKDDLGWKAWGSPYAGSSRCYENCSCLVKAIVILRQSKQCALRRMSGIEAFKAIWAGATVHSWDKRYMETACDMVRELIQNIPVFEFCCTPDEQAVDYLETEFKKEVL